MLQKVNEQVDHASSADRDPQQLLRPSLRVEARAEEAKEPDEGQSLEGVIHRAHFTP